MVQDHELPMFLLDDLFRLASLTGSRRQHDSPDAICVDAPHLQDQRGLLSGHPRFEAAFVECSADGVGAAFVPS